MTDYTLSATITPQQICDQIITAFEGGSNYWLISADMAPNSPQPDALESPWYATEALFALPDWAIDIKADDDAKTYRLDRDAVTKAVTLMAQSQSEHLGNLLADCGDAETADVFLQMALFGEIVYG
jgi:hypothetical protein